MLKPLPRRAEKRGEDKRPTYPKHCKVVNHSVGGRTFHDLQGNEVGLGEVVWLPRPYGEYLRSKGLVTIIE